jgi:uncharacterized membrane protein
VFETIEVFARFCAAIMEILGISVILLVAIYALIRWGLESFKHEQEGIRFNQVRQRLGSGILLGLEFLVAADIIYTVAVELTFKTVGVLAIIVLIRTFLSFTLEVEITGSWPWQKK